MLGWELWALEGALPGVPARAGQASEGRHAQAETYQKVRRDKSGRGTCLKQGHLKLQRAGVSEGTVRGFLRTTWPAPLENGSPVSSLGCLEEGRPSPGSDRSSLHLSL